MSKRRDPRNVKTQSPSGLYWSETGRIECADHAPYEGSDTWVHERYEPMPVEAALDAVRAGMPGLRCEVCGRRARTVYVEGEA